MLFLSTLIPKESKWNLLFSSLLYSEGLGYIPYFQGGLGIHTNKLYFPCRTNRMLALNSKNLNFHFATQSGMIIEKKTLLSQPWIKNSLWFLGNKIYSKNPLDIFLYHGFSFISKLLMFPGNQSSYCNYLLTKYPNIIIIKIILFNLFNLF